MSVQTSVRADTYQLRLMPSWELWCDGGKVDVFLRQQRLLAVLAVHGPSRRELVAGLLWPDSPERSALDSLRVSIHHVNHSLPGMISVERHAVALHPGVRVDLCQEWELLEGGTSNGPRAAHLPGALPLLLGWYEDWVLNEQSRLLHARTAYLRRRAGECLARRDFDGAVESAAQCLSVDVLDEAALETMVLAQLALGRCVSALRAIVLFRGRAHSELGITQSPTLTRLEERVRRCASSSLAGFPVGNFDRWVSSEVVFDAPHAG